MQTSRLSRALVWATAVATIFYLALFIFSSVARTGRFSPDSMSYINVAQNILAGKGITQPTLGFNQQSFSIEDKPPVPFTAQAPLYPLMIALVSRLGVSPARSALLLSAIGNVFVLLIVYRLASALFDKTVGLLAAALLLFYFPLRWIASWAWSEPIGSAFLLFSLQMLATERTKRNRWLVLIAGLASGLAFATRYAFIPLLGVGVLFLLLDSDSWQRRVNEVILYTLGFAIAAGPVLARNLVLLGRLMPSFNPVRVGFTENVISVLQTTFGGYLAAISPNIQIGLLGLSAIIIGSALTLRRDLVRGLRDVFIADRRYLLILWSAGYLAFMIVQRCFSYFDVDARTIAPAGVILVVIWSAAAVRATKMPTFYATAIALVLLLLAIGREAQATLKTSGLNFEEIIRQSERLSWIAKNTSERDLIVGDDVVDIPFFLHHAPTLSFSPYPYTEYATYEKIVAYARRHCRDYDHVYVILRRNSATEEEWKSAYGEFFADLVFGRAQNYPDIIPLQSLNDGYVFQVACL